MTRRLRSVEGPGPRGPAGGSQSTLEGEPSDTPLPRPSTIAHSAYLLAAALLLVGLLAWNTARDETHCRAGSHGLAYDYGYLSGCRYVVNDQLVPAGKLRFLPDGRILMRVDTVSA